MSGRKIPEEIVNYIFRFAFYPHQYPYEKYKLYNKCIQDIPKINKSFFMIEYKNNSFLHCMTYKHKIFNKKYYIKVYYNYLEYEDLLF